MLTIIVQTIEFTRSEYSCASSRDLDNMCKIIESSAYCKAFKVVDSDNGVLSDLKKLGVDNYGKFVTEFKQE